MDAPAVHPHVDIDVDGPPGHAAFRRDDAAAFAPTADTLAPATTAAHEYVEACIMLALGEGPTYGYGLSGGLNGLGLAGLDRGRVYRALRAMEAAGLVTSQWDTAGRGPARRVYELTERGYERLAVQAVAVRRQRRELSRFLSRYERVRPAQSEAVA
jgi:PadR family transcriptional regulator PadR